MTADRGPTAPLVDEWIQARADLRAMDEAEHPPISDKFGRDWTWTTASVYVHDQMAWTEGMIRSGQFGLPRADRLRDNPNYDLCSICTADWQKQGQRQPQ